MRATEIPAADAVAPGASLESRVAFLSDGASYPAGTRHVERIETHLSWVFLTETHAYKLKKPQRFDHYDLASVEARRRHCVMEVRLNRRLSDDVYLGALPLARDARGALHLGEGGEAIDWLVWMRRLPRALMLDEMIRAKAVHPRDVRALAATLARFYRACAPAEITGAELRARFASRIAHNVAELARYAAVLPLRMVEDIGARQVAFLEREAALLDARVDAGFVVEGHGDLRPEHVCLEARPQIIDCLEFSRELRTLDSAEELGFLALECERLGAARLGAGILTAYGEASGDPPPARLVRFYQAHHALVRARLAVRHLDDTAPREPARWAPQARDYLRLAEERLQRPDDARAPS